MKYFAIPSILALAAFAAVFGALCLASAVAAEAMEGSHE